MNPKDYRQIVYDIIGAEMRVHGIIGWGLLEPIYNEALCLELQDRGIRSESEKLIPCFYKNHQLDKFYKMDIVVDDVIIELKSVKYIVPSHRAQLFNYMRLTKKPIGLLINFGSPSLQGERYAYIDETNECFLLDKEMNLLYPEYAEDDEE